eukprot:TRINITY_DN1618_c0_g3_i1.p1 TRINITY_DN1618_c0_g3~~TRINITY_DN1618_c0_g3_i1.p1  ORF type:complete len:458 (+),score=137.88 TRINITY_DN1618_c0_g3_i1:30-1376(+)
MASAVFILDLSGKLLICRDYRGDVKLNMAERFVQKILDEDEVDVKPVMNEDGITYSFVKYSGLILLAATRSNANVTSILLFLYHLIHVFEEYFTELEEESIRDNFVIIYELLDEMMDFGYPQITESKILQEYITQESHRLESTGSSALAKIKGAFSSNSSSSSSSKGNDIPDAVTDAVSWRPPGIVHRRNEVFLDVVETVNLLVNSNGHMLHSEILGAIKMRCYLSGMPELRLGLNDKLLFETHGRNVAKSKAVDLEDIKFHQCVRLSRFENDRTISFIPPDGEFDLMNYRLSTAVRPLIWIESVVESHSHSRVEFLIKARSQFKQKSTANNVEIIIPVPPDASSPKFKTSMGNVEYAPEQDAIVWTLKSFTGGKEYLMRAHFALSSIDDEENTIKQKPIQVKFEIPYFTVSGIQVRYLKIIEKSGYQALPWVRYITQAGDYQCRIAS